MNEVSDAELLQTIGDFLEQGLVENIVSMFKADADYYRFVGDLLRDERFRVRMGVAVLFEWLIEERPEQVELAIPFLESVLAEETAYMRGDTLTVLGIIGTDRALALVRKKLSDPDPQVAEIAQDIVKQ
ncbi:MAG: HEAT repeat domain-containing protein [Desulfobulbaceae bacterium]|nr:HEAT repeat domain-containing protein [Desulfobulbaceae bacterium]